MNKTLLLIIIDFLFLNLIALTHWENAEPVRPLQPPVPEVAANAPTKNDDLVETMRESLADEAAAQAALEQKLAFADTNLSAREQSLTETEAERAKLAAALAGSRQTDAELNRELAAAAQESTMTKDQLAQLQRELEEKRDETARQQRQLADLEKQQADAHRQIEGLTVAVVVGEAEKQQLQQQAASLQQQVQTERADRIRVESQTTQLAQGVNQLAQRSGELTQEIRNDRPVNPNTLYNDFLANRVAATFTAVRAGLFGPVNRSKETPTVFITDGRRVYALLHIEDTSFSLLNPNHDWNRIDVAFTRPSGYRTDAAEMDFLAVDPRVVVVPVTPRQVADLGAKVYRLAQDPFKFPEAVLINVAGQGYGALDFKLDPDQPGYVRVDNRFFKRLFGDFSPSRGDLAFSQSGELLGIMVNRDYCALLKDFTPAVTLRTGGGGTAGKTGAVLDGIAARVQAMPLALQ